MAATRIVSCFPKLQRLFITWYEEDDLSAEGIAKALRPLNEMEELREVQLLRSGGNCGWLVVQGEGSSSSNSTTTDTAAAVIGRALPAVRRVLVHETPKQCNGSEQPLWEMEDAVDMLPTASLCRGLAPRWPLTGGGGSGS